ncbi:RHS repeat-associated core domain-containing protein [Apibacter adventoris]|uniref:Teneurin-like YD-shell domain-containing protein n=1 Tax=Apibacter adventoris TaxID=1679466 RepID=A0A2S8A9M0_9FLAO|nr:RHS repeat-associated core domain-containing protein [Apibacter adventoris]PQL91275.1 hypothetical protein C4S77_08425 [Apibacter adventoris]
MFKAYFEVLYHGKDHNDYVNGAVFCCAGKGKKLQTYGGGIGKVNEEYEKMQYYNHADHLGSSSYITNLDAQIVQHVEYVSFGEVFIEERNQSWNNPYLFNGKELDEETGLYYYGARYYNKRESVWLSTDPLSGYNPILEDEHYIDGEHNEGVYNSFNLNTYGYCYQNPVLLVDPNGKQVVAVFNKSTNLLAIIPDKSKINPKLSYKFVSAKEYSKLTGKDKKQYNYGILIKNVFTGGLAENGEVTRDPNRPQQRAIPNGTYDILDNNADTKHKDWFRLDKQDHNRYNDRDDTNGRDGFRLHLGVESWGCVTADISVEDRKEEWSIIKGAIEGTTTTTVPEKRGRQKWNPFSKLTNYGTLTVKGDDKVPEKK